MTDQPASSSDKISTANVKQKSKGFSPVWVIPIVAALVGGWMVFENLHPLVGHHPILAYSPPPLRRVRLCVR